MIQVEKLSYAFPEKELYKDISFTLEEGVRLGGLGERVKNFVAEKNLDVKVEIIAIPDEYVEHGNVDILKKEVGVDTESVVKRIVSAFVGL